MLSFQNKKGAFKLKIKRKKYVYCNNLDTSMQTLKKAALFKNRNH